MKNRKHKIILISILTIILMLLIVPMFSKSILKAIYPLKYKEYVYRYANKYNLDPYLVFAVIKTESNFRENVKSNKEAKGLMQISPITGEWAAKVIKIKNYNESMLYYPKINIEIGCWYISRLKLEFDNDTTKMLAAYNGGSGNVNIWVRNQQYSKDGIHLNTIPFIETKNFVRKVTTYFKTYVYLYDPNRL